MSAAFVWPLLAASSLIWLSRVVPLRGTWYPATVFVLGALAGALTVLN